MPGLRIGNNRIKFAIKSNINDTITVINLFGTDTMNYNISNKQYEINLMNNTVTDIQTDKITDEITDITDKQ